MKTKTFHARQGNPVTRGQIKKWKDWMKAHHWDVVESKRVPEIIGGKVGDRDCSIRIHYTATRRAA